jgi:hypothetical protein
MCVRIGVKNEACVSKIGYKLMDEAGARTHKDTTTFL